MNRKKRIDICNISKVYIYNKVQAMYYINEFECKKYENFNK